jgi:hypothetical protein
MPNSPQSTPYAPDATLDSINIKSFGNVTLRNVTDALNHAATMIVRTPTRYGTIFLPPHAYRMTTSCTVSERVRLAFDFGATISVDSGKTLTILGPIEAGRYQIFDGDGTVTISNGHPVFLEWWGAAGDGTTDDTDAFTAALANGGHVVGTAGKTYRITDSLTLVSNTILDLNGATILQDAETSVFTATGTLGADGTFPSNIAAGDYTFALAVGDGANWDAGDYIVLKSDDIDNANTGTPEKTRALHQIKSVSTDTVVLYDTVDFPYTTANASRYAKMTPVENVTLRNLKFTNGNDSANSGYLAQFTYCANITLENIDAYDFGGGIQFTDCHTFTATDIRMRRVTDFTVATGVAFGYGILAASGSCYGTITRFIAHDLRHCFTTIGWNNQTHSGPRYITVADSVGTATDNTDSTGIWDTHQGGYQITFRNCLAMGGNSNTAGFQLRCHHTNLIDCRAIHVGGRALSCSNGADYITWDGGEVGWCAGAGSVATRNYFRLLNVYMHHSGSSSSGYGISGDYCEARNCVFEDNAAAGILASSASITTLATIRNNTFIKGTNQGVGVESPDAQCVIEDNDFMGYTVGWIGSPAAGVKIRRNTGYVTENEGATSVADNGTIAHGLSITPTAVMVTTSVANEYASVTTIGTTTFTVQLTKDDGTAGTTQTVYWRAVKLF